jgi:hypothetical protein
MIDYVISDKLTKWDEITYIEILNKDIPLMPINVSDHKALQVNIEIAKAEHYGKHEIDQYVSQNITLVKWNKQNIAKYKILFDDELTKVKIEEMVNILLNETKEDAYKHFVKILQTCIENAKHKLIEVEIQQKKNKYRKVKEVWNEDMSNINRLKRFHSVMVAKYDDAKARSIRKYYKQRMRHVYRRELKAIHTRKIQKLNEAYMNDKSSFWQTIKNRDRNMETVDAPMDQIEDYYDKIFNSMNTINDDDLNNINKSNIILLDKISTKKHNIKIQYEIVENIIKRLKNKKAAGHQKTENECFKYSNTGRISKIISKFFQYMINNNIMIEELNIGVIKLLIKDKKKDNTDLNNTRPITVSDTLATIFEAIMMLYIKQGYIEANQQMGFKSNSSTLHAIFTLKEQLLFAHYNKKKLVLCFIDFSKAFDKINKDIMLYKLRKYVSPSIWSAIYKYVKIAQVYILNKGERSKNIKVKDGVKQGGKASPMLFSMYIDEMIQILRKDINTFKIYNKEYGVLCYADDTVIICESTSKMNKVLEKVTQYCKMHYIKINGDKSEVMYINYTKIQISKEKVILNGCTLTECKKFKYLGVWITSNLNENEQIRARINKCQSSFFSLNKVGLSHIHGKTKVKTTLYKMYCRATLLYGIETTHLNKNQLLNIRKTESMLIKKMTVSNKFSSTNKIMKAMEINTIESEIEKRKVRLFGQLIQNSFTYDFISESIKNNQLHTKSLMHEIIGKVKLQQACNIDEIYEQLNEKMVKITREEKIEFKEIGSSVIRYLLDNRTKKNNIRYKLLVDNII